jgi:hypothetical protein
MPCDHLGNIGKLKPRQTPPAVRAKILFNLE